MGIYIAEEAPKGCLGCKLHNPMGVYDQCFGTRSIIDEFTYDGDPKNPTRPDDCPLVSVSPHGDLIDRDALKKKRHWTDDFYETEYVEVEDIDAAPTVIPAEEGE